MGEQTDSKLYFSVNGVDYTELVGIHTATLDTAENPSERKISALDGGYFTARLKTPKVLRCRSRKRFVKLLMSVGFPRNIADKARVKPPDTYSNYWWYMFLLGITTP